MAILQSKAQHELPFFSRLRPLDVYQVRLSGGNLRIKTLETIRDATTDIYEEQRAVEELTKLLSKPLQLNDIAPQIRELRTQIEELQSADRINYEEKVAAARQKYLASRSAELEVTGIATFVEFTP